MRQVARLFAPVVMAAFLAVGCSAIPPLPGVSPVGTAASLKTAPATPATITAIQVSSGDLMPAFDPRTTRYSVTSLNLAGGVQIKVSTSTDATVSLAGTLVPSNQWVPLKPSVLDDQCAMAITGVGAGGDRHVYELCTLPVEFPPYEVTTDHPRPGVICMSADTYDDKGPFYLFSMDELGNLLFFRKTPTRAMDFQQHRAPDGAVRYSYLQEEGSQVLGSFCGAIHLLDGNFKELKSVSLLPHGDHGSLPADTHEFIYLDDDHYLLEAYQPKTVSNLPASPGATSSVAAAIIQEIQNGQVLFEWDSTNYPEFYANASDGNDYANTSRPIADYVHLNAMQIDPQDGNLIISCRHQDQVLKLDRSTGRIIWRLGGKDSDFPLTATQRFSHQHFARRNPDGTLTLFDNGNASQSTRILTFTLDEAARTVTAFDAFSPETRYSGAMGSVQKLDPATFFIGWGLKVTGFSDAVELTRDGTRSFDFAFVDPNYSSYRALKYPSN